MLIFVDQCEYCISWSRIDPCANALFVLIALQPAHFQETASDVIAQQPVGIQGALMDSFQQLLTNDGVDFTRMDRANRLKFVKNTKAFVVRVRPLVTYQ